MAAKLPTTYYLLVPGDKGNIPLPKLHIVKRWNGDNNSTIMDFTIENYKSLIAALQSQHYTFTRFDDRVSSGDDCTVDKNVILRHDVDLLPQNALKMAQIEHDLGIRGAYYFRIVPESFDAEVTGVRLEVRGSAKQMADRQNAEARGRMSG